MQFAFGPKDPHIDFDLGAPGAGIKLVGPGSDARPALKKERIRGEYVFTRNGIVVPYPDLVRFVWLRFSDPSPDLEGEACRAQTFRMCADASVRKWGGWIDLNHWSRSARFPKSLAAAGRSPVEFVIGKLTEIRVTPADVSYAEGYLWPASANLPPEALSKMHEHADLAWGWLKQAPSMVKCSAGGPLVKHSPKKVRGRMVTPIDIYLNHLAICLQGVHSGTDVRTRPFGAFREAAKAVSDGVQVVEPPMCPGGGFECFVRGLDEAHKAVTAGGTQHFVPEDLEGRKGPLDFDEGPSDCGHLVGGRFPTDHEAIAHLTECLRWPTTRARRYLEAARTQEAA